MTVYCWFCDHLHTATRDETKPWAFRCMKAPTTPGYKYNHPTYSPDPPYHRTEDVNKYGDCEMFTPRREAEPPPIMNRSARHAS